MVFDVLGSLGEPIFLLVRGVLASLTWGPMSLLVLVERSASPASFCLSVGGTCCHGTSGGLTPSLNSVMIFSISDRTEDKEPLLTCLVCFGSSVDILV